MNWDRIAGEWKQLKGKVQAKWAKLTDDDLQAVAARKDALVGKIQERYGILRDEAERQVDEWIAKVGQGHGPTPQPPAKVPAAPPSNPGKRQREDGDRPSHDGIAAYSGIALVAIVA